MEKGKLYTVITGDLVSSKKMDNRAFLQEKIQQIMNRVNKHFQSHLIVPFNFTGGDEFQALVDKLKVSFDIAKWWERELYPWRVRLGVGRGEISTPIADTTSSMDGPCFHRAREAVERAKRENRYLVYNTEDFVLNTSVNTILLLMEALQRDWKEIHYRRYWLYRELGTLEKVAVKEGVSRQAVVKTLKAAKYNAILEAERGVKEILINFEEKSPYLSTL